MADERACFAPLLDALAMRSTCVNAVANASAGRARKEFMEDLLMPLLYLVVTVFLFRHWLADFRAHRSGQILRGAFPGATMAPARLIVLAVCGGVVLSLGATAAECFAGVSAEQSDVAAVALVTWLCAAFAEELIFRGYLVVTGRGRMVGVAAVVLVSLCFALLHNHLWKLPEGASFFEVWKAQSNFTPQAWISFCGVFINSLFFYWLRFMPWNTKRSLSPCFAAHLAVNTTVFLVKLCQGHVTGWIGV